MQQMPGIKQVIDKGEQMKAGEIYKLVDISLNGPYRIKLISYIQKIDAYEIKIWAQDIFTGKTDWYYSSERAGIKREVILKEYIKEE